MTSSNDVWKLCIDTGGTFTDCLAADPNGKEYRCKVLSSSALRGTAVKSTAGGRVKINLDGSPADDFFAGYQFLLLNDPDQQYEISGYDSHSSELIFNNKPELPVNTPIPFEIRSPEEAPVLAARLITNTPIGKPLPPIKMRLSTTKGTNALLERRGANSLFLITAGFADLLKIRNQQRPELFSLNIQKPQPFYHRIIEVPERLDANGNVIRDLDLNNLKSRIEPFVDEIDSAAICLMHSYLNPGHEIEIEKLLRELGVNRISRSSGLSREIKIVPRAITADVNACLAPVIEEYLERISGVMADADLKVMTSAGNLARAGHFHPKDGLLSGPAGGVIGAAAIGKRVAEQVPKGFESPGGFDRKEAPKIISFDMGGTSTDVARFDGEIDYIFEHTVGDAILSAPAIDIETVAAGGGSICDFDGKSLTVGPGSAGADPGPACYGRGGPLTITDVNLLSGRLHPANFHISIMPEAAEQRLEEIMNRMNGARLRGAEGYDAENEDGEYAAEQRNQILSRKQVLNGFLDIANERMAQAIRKISIQKGFNPADYALVAFGGAGAQHALSVAGKLNIKTVLVPSDAGLLSAYGLQQAKSEQIASRQVLKLLKDVKPKLSGWFDKLSDEGKSGLMDQGIEENRVDITRKQLFLRLKGQDSSLGVDWTNPDEIENQFKKIYREQYGHWLEGRDIEVEIIRVVAGEKSPEVSQDTDSSTVSEKHPSLRQLAEDSPSAGSRIPAGQGEIYYRENLVAGARLKGPSLILDPHSTTVIDPGWHGLLLDDGTWILQSKIAGGLRKENRPEAIQLQLYTNRFRSVADQMGEMLQRTALSVNVKERLDFSCAILDADGYLVVNAPHIPVHLGAMGTCVRTLIELSKNKDLSGFGNLTGLRQFEEGDVIITNHPGFGGSHLPDITVVTPVFYQKKLIGFAANRAHHAEIGGSRPGSMPPDANNLAEEGVVIPPTFIAKKGKFDWNTIRNLLENNAWPTRAIEENMADLQAAVAANHRGVTGLKKLCDDHTPGEVRLYMQKLKAYASERMKLSLKKMPDDTYSAEEELDDGSLLKVSCTVNEDTMRIDFSGTSDVHPGNLNANPSILNSVIMYVLRLIVNEPLPLNDGLLEPVEIIIPNGMLNPEFPDDPEKCPAVVGGNIETSQRLTDTLLKAFSLAACSYGTMNNVLFGNDTFGYYETVAGGTGAGNGFHGADAVHQHMTNTRAADPEILEHRYPVRLNRYAIREKSGGDGRWKGGNGLIREMTFLEPVRLSVLAQHRVIPPYGLNGGKNGETGQHWVEFKDGTTKELKWRDGAELSKGDRFILHTPGGGGFSVR